MNKRNRSKLAPYATLVGSLRKEGHTYREIVKILKETEGIVVGRNTVHSFVKVRARRPKKVYTMLETLDLHPIPGVSPKSDSRETQAGIRQDKNDPTEQPHRRRFHFTFSDSYNLTRLTPDEKAALEKRLDDELRGQS